MFQQHHPSLSDQIGELSRSEENATLTFYYLSTVVVATNSISFCLLFYQGKKVTDWPLGQIQGTFSKR